MMSYGNRRIWRLGLYEDMQEIYWKKAKCYEESVGWVDSSLENPEWLWAEIKHSKLMILKSG